MRKVTKKTPYKRPAKKNPCKKAVRKNPPKKSPPTFAVVFFDSRGVVKSMAHPQGTLLKTLEEVKNKISSSQLIDSAAIYSLTDKLKAKISKGGRVKIY